MISWLKFSKIVIWIMKSEWWSWILPRKLDVSLYLSLLRWNGPGSRVSRMERTLSAHSTMRRKRERQSKGLFRIKEIGGKEGRKRPDHRIGPEEAETTGWRNSGAIGRISWFCIDTFKNARLYIKFRMIICGSNSKDDPDWENSCDSIKGHNSGRSVLLFLFRL